MDPRLRSYYEDELLYIKEMGAEFAKAFPKIASRLNLNRAEVKVDDPYVERLLEGFAFLAARVQLKIDSEFPRFTENLLDVVYPHYLPPMPSMAVVQLQPTLDDNSLAAGPVVERGTSLNSIRYGTDRTSCEFRTAHDVALWPLKVTEAKYFSSAGALQTIKVDRVDGVRAGIRISLQTTAGVSFDQLPIDRLVLYLRGPGKTPGRLHEQILGNGLSFVVRQKGGARVRNMLVGKSGIESMGFESSESLLPPSSRSFEGYRYLQEYYAFPERYFFVALSGLKETLAQCNGTEAEIIILLSRSDPSLENVIDETNFLLNCTPVINLFPKTADRIHLSNSRREYLVIPDRTRPRDFEVWSVKGVQGFGSGSDPEQEFLPLYASHDQTAFGHNAFYTIHREKRRISARERSRKPRAKRDYVGSETYISVVDPGNAPYRSALRQLGVKTLCTNRDLPLQMSIGDGESDFTISSGAPVTSVKCVAGPTDPRASYAHGDVTWRLISHLSLNYLSLRDSEQTDGAAALRTLLNLYIDQNDDTLRKQIEGVRSININSVNGRIPTGGPITFGRGVEIHLTCDESAFAPTGTFLFGLVMKEFFARYVSVNSFATTVLHSTDRGETMRWPPSLGRVQTL